MFTEAICQETEACRIGKKQGEYLLRATSIMGRAPHPEMYHNELFTLY